MTEPKITPPTRLVVSTGRRAEPHLYQAHPITRYERVVAWIKRHV